MLLKKETENIQNDLASYCRDGKMREIQGVRSDRLPHYRRLVFNVMYGLLEKAFPITTSILSEGEFKSLVTLYMTEHDAQEVEVWRVPGEFSDFLKVHPMELKLKYPFLSDLIEMEWTEILVYNMENAIIPEFSESVFSENNRLVLNPDRSFLTLSYPVFQKNRENIVNRKSNYYLLIFRNINTNKVHFMELSALHVRLFEYLGQGEIVKNAIEILRKEFNLTDEINAELVLMNFLLHLKTKGFVLGSVL